MIKKLFVILALFISSSLSSMSSFADSLNFGWGHAGTVVRYQGETKAGGVANVWGLGWKTSIREQPMYFEVGLSFSAAKFQPSPRLLLGPLFQVGEAFLIYPHVTYQYTPKYSGGQEDNSLAGAVVLGVKIDKVLLLGLVLSIGIVGIEDDWGDRRYIFAIGPKVSIPIVGW